MEPENHLFEKENHLNQTSIFGFHVNFQGCSFQRILVARIIISTGSSHLVSGFFHGDRKFPS